MKGSPTLATFGAGVLVLLLTDPLSAQRAVATDEIEYAAAVWPDTVTVGERFRMGLRILAPAGAQLRFTPVAPDSTRLQLLGSARITPPAGDRREYRVELEGVAWVAGVRPALQGELTVEMPPGAEQRVVLPLTTPWVRTVLPADTASLAPRGPKDIFARAQGRETPWWLIALGAALLAVAVAVATWWRRRRSASADAVAGDARSAALAALRSLGAAGLVESGDAEHFYERLSRIVRDYAATLSPDWTADLTSSELVSRSRGSLAPLEADRLAHLLGVSDLAKFARARPTAEQMRSDLAAAAGWVQRVPASGRAEGAGAG